MGLGKLIKRAAKVSAELTAEIDRLVPANPGEGTPRVIAYYDRAGKVRRLVVNYPNGWSVRVNVNAKGYVTSTSYRCTFKAMVRAAQASSSEAIGDKNA